VDAFGPRGDIQAVPVVDGGMRERAVCETGHHTPYEVGGEKEQNVTACHNRSLLETRLDTEVCQFWSCHALGSLRAV